MSVPDVIGLKLNKQTEAVALLLSGTKNAKIESTEIMEG